MLPYEKERIRYECPVDSLLVGRATRCLLYASTCTVHNKCSGVRVHRRLGARPRSRDRGHGRFHGLNLGSSAARPSAGEQVLRYLYVEVAPAADAKYGYMQADPSRHRRAHFWARQRVPLHASLAVQGLIGSYWPAHAISSRPIPPSPALSPNLTQTNLVPFLPFTVPPVCSPQIRVNSSPIRRTEPGPD